MWFALYGVDYDEVDQSAWQPTHDSNTKIDYIWINDALHATDFDAVFSPVAPVSDHYYFKGSLSFSSTCP